MMETEPQVRTYKPANDKQKLFINSKERYVLLSGAVAAGKSLNGCWKGLYLNLKYPGNRGLICRKEARSLHDSTVRTLLEQVIPPSMIVSYNKFTGVIEHKTSVKGKNSFIHLCGLDKKAGQQYPTKIGSTEFGWIFLDEGVEADEGDWQMLATRLRYKIPGSTEEQHKNQIRQIFTATNPESPDHWMHKFFFESDNKDRLAILTTPYDNPFLPKDYLEKLEENLSGISKERLLFGKWVGAEGLVYDSFDPAKHVVSKEELLPYKDYKKIIGGADSNYPLPRAGILIGIKGNGLDILDEFYQERAQPEQLAEWFSEIGKEHDIIIDVYHDPSDPAAINKLNTFSNINCMKADNSVLPGISLVANFFNKDKIRIADRCVNYIRELKSYRWKTGRNGEVVDKTADHSQDSARYALMSYYGKPQEYTVLSDRGGAFF